ncbi:MAG: ABC transporter permease [Saprospiraceae bacterium]|nr:ABC transporter permease [Saprospiraceae bacterium]
MIKNALLLALRQLLRDRSTTLLHLTGLTLGIAGFLFILQYVFFENSYDRFHANAGRLFRIAVDIERNGRPNMASAAVYAGVGPGLKNDFPEVETYTRMAHGESLLHIGSERFREEQSWYVDTDFFTMFSFPLLNGDAASALREPGSVVVTEKIARKYFGHINCLGQSMEADNFFGNRMYKITGVVKDLPENTHLTGQIFFSYSTLDTRPNFVPDWGWRDFKTYVLLRQQADRPVFEQKITAGDWIGSKSPVFAEREMRHHILLQAVPEIYTTGLRLEQEFKPGGDPTALRYLTLIAVLVLGLAWMNYVNLGTARAIERARDIGLRRVIGAQRAQVLGPYVVHALLLNVLALLLALGLLWALQPYFAQLIGKPVGFAWLENKDGWVVAMGGFLAGMLLVALYPAWVISGMSPLQFMRGKKALPGSGQAWLRKGLIVFQFGVSAALIVATLVVWRQLEFMRQGDLGIQIDQTLVMRAPIPFDEAAYSRYQVFRQKLLENPRIEAVTASHNVPGDEDTWNNGIRRFNAADPADRAGLIAHINAVEPEFLTQYGLVIRAGRNFDRTHTTDRRALVVTETLARRFGYQTPESALNARFLMRGDTFTVVGVSADYHQYGLQRAAEPYAFFQEPEELRRFSVRLSGQDIAASAAFVERTWKETWPAGVYESRFLDVHFDQQYRAEVRTGRLFTLFSGLAIFIACLGLFGLSAYMALQRTREVGIRKVLGAGAVSITALLAGDFVRMVLLALLLAAPVAYWSMDQWLGHFAFRTDLPAWIFGLAGMLVVSVALATVGFHSIRTAWANPVDSLRE